MRLAVNNTAPTLWTGSSSTGSQPCSLATVAQTGVHTLCCGRTSSSSSSTAMTMPVGTNSKSTPTRTSVVAHDHKRNRNPYLDIQKDLLPDGKPNTPWRRLQLRIRNTTSLQGLLKLYLSNRHKSAVWRPIHSAGIIMRLAALHYYRVILPPYQLDERTSAAALQLLSQITPDFADPSVCRVFDAARLAQVIVVISTLHPRAIPQLNHARTSDMTQITQTVQVTQIGSSKVGQIALYEALDPLVREIMREGAKKLPSGKPDLLAELASALARLQWKETNVWLAIATAAKGQLRARQLQQAEDQQQQQQSSLQQHGTDAAEQHWQQPQQHRGSTSQATDWKQQQRWQQQADQQQLTWQGEQLQQDVRGEWEGAGGSLADPDDEFEGYDEYGDLGEDDLYIEDPSYWSLPTADTILVQHLPPEEQQRQHQQQLAGYGNNTNSSNSSSIDQAATSQPWLSMCHPKLAAAVAAVGLDDSELMQLLGFEVVHVLPLLSLADLADLCSAYAQLSMVHDQLLPELKLQLQKAIASTSWSSSNGSGSGSRGSEVAAAIKAAHALGQLGFADLELVQAVQTAVLSSRSVHGTKQSGSTMLPASSTAHVSAPTAVGPAQFVQLLQLLMQSGCTSSGNGRSNSSRSKVTPLVRWVCTAIAAAGLEALQPAQLAAAAVALSELQQYPEAVAAASVVGTAAVARSYECRPEVLAEVLSCCVMLGCAEMILADIAVTAVENAAADLLQLRQHQRKEGNKKKGKQHPTRELSLLPAPDTSATIVAMPELPPVMQQQQSAVMSPKHQAQLIMSLQQMGRHDLLQRAMSACNVGSGLPVL